MASSEGRGGDADRRPAAAVALLVVVLGRRGRGGGGGRARGRGAQLAAVVVAVAGVLAVVADLVVAELGVLAAVAVGVVRGGGVVAVAAWSRWPACARCGGGRRVAELVVVAVAGVRAVVADLVVAELVVVAELHEVAVVADLVVAELGVLPPASMPGSRGSVTRPHRRSRPRWRCAGRGRVGGVAERSRQGIRWSPCSRPLDASTPPGATPARPGHVAGVRS